MTSVLSMLSWSLSDRIQPETTSIHWEIRPCSSVHEDGVSEQNPDCCLRSDADTDHDLQSITANRRCIRERGRGQEQSPVLHCTRWRSYGRPADQSLIQLITTFGKWCRNESIKYQYRTWQICSMMSKWAGLQQSVVDEALDQWLETQSLCWCTFRTVALTLLVTCFTYHNCVESVTFLPLLYCCKLLNKDLRILQGSTRIYTVLRWCGQNYKHLLHVSSECCSPNLIKIGWCLTELCKK